MTIADAPLPLTQMGTNVHLEHIAVEAKRSGRPVSRSQHQRRHGATRSLRQRGLSASSDTESGEHRPRHSRGASSSRSSSLSSSTSSLSSVQSSVRSSASSSPSWIHRPPSRHHRRHHHHRRHGHSQWESHSPTPFVSCAPPPHNRIISKIKRGKYIDFDDPFWLLGVGQPGLALYHLLQATGNH